VRTRTLLSLGISALLAGAALMPAGASALDLRERQVQPNVLLLTADRDFVNEVGITWVTSPGGAPDLVIGDLSAGISDPIPSQCGRVDTMSVRCPADLFTKIVASLGPGSDSLDVVPAVGVGGLVTMTLQLGPGNDRASDGGHTYDLWYGGKGRDELASGPGNDLVSGGAQNDVIDCGAGKHDVGIGGPGKLDLGRHCETVRH
jgi:Ca2+-binding RTX toxin-like protein